MADMVQNIQNTRQCPICSEVVTNKKTHINMHYGMRDDYQCRYCEKIFAHRDNLRRHECVHTVEDESVFSSLHSKERLLKCRYCPKTFQYSSRLMEHHAIHSKDRPYTCLYCPKTFKTVYSVWDHLVVNHSKLTHNSKVKIPKSEIKSTPTQKTTQSMKVKGYHRNIRYRLPASMQNVNLCPRVVLSRSLTEALSKV